MLFLFKGKITSEKIYFYTHVNTNDVINNYNKFD